MRVKLEQVSKRFRYEWVLKRVELEITENSSWAVAGPNGSGKSTLMRIIAGYLSPSRGKVKFTLGGQPLETSQIYRHLSIAAPYVELIEELKLLEALRFHQRFKPFRDQLQPEDLLDLLQFKKADQKLIRNFSSGMKQRLKLLLALASDSSLLLLDEPTTNLDEQGVRWYLELIEQFAQDRSIIVASNVAVDFGFCDQKFNILDYK